MTDDKQEPSAFPNGNLFKNNRGLTIRDFFAAHAPDPTSWFAPLFDANNVPETAEMRYFRWRYYYADAMLAQREK